MLPPCFFSSFRFHPFRIMPLIEKFIEIEASVGRVFDLVSDFENFPRWMSNIRSVERLDRYSTLWTAATAFGTDVEWEAVTTQFEPDERIVWHSVRGDLDAAVEIVLSETNRGTTLMRLLLDYDFPVGISRAEAARAASIFGDNPRRQLEDDLQRFKRIAERSSQRFISPPSSSRERRERFYDVRERTHPLEFRREEYVRERGARRHHPEEARMEGERRRNERFEEALRAARISQQRDMERYRNERDIERRAQFEREAQRDGRENPRRQPRDEREAYSPQENRRLISPRDRMREADKAREESGRRFDREYTERFSRRGVDLLLDDEAPSRRFRRRKD
jgi:uncharacterized membrane protein